MKLTNQLKFSSWLRNRRHAAVAVLTAGLLTGLPAEDTAAETTLERIKSEGAVRIGFSNFRPTSFVAGDGYVTGASPELARAFLESIGVATIDGVVGEFGSLIGGLHAERFDMIAVAMQIQPKRCEQIAFGNPEFKYLQSFVVKEGNPLNLKSFQDVAYHPDARLGMLTGAGQIRYAEIAGVPEDRHVLFPDFMAAVAGLQADRVDVVSGAGVTLRSVLEKVDDPSVEYIDLSEQPLDESGEPVSAYAGTGFRKGDDDLLAAWNQWLVDARESGQLLDILQEFGFSKANLPEPGMTSEKLCSPD